MNRFVTYLLITASFALIAIAAAGCESKSTGAASTDPGATPTIAEDKAAIKAIATKFANALEEKDGATVCSVSSPAGQAEVLKAALEFGLKTTDCAKAMTTFAAMVPDFRFSAGEIKVDGNNATIKNPLAVEDQDKVIDLVRVGGVWKIAGEDEGKSSGGKDRVAVARAWPKAWCKAKVGVTRAQIEKIMGKPSTEVSLEDAAQDGIDPQMTWEFAEWQFSAFFDSDDRVRQLDVNDIELSAAKKRQIKCEFVRR